MHMPKLGISIYRLASNSMVTPPAKHHYANSTGSLGRCYAITFKAPNHLEPQHLKKQVAEGPGTKASHVSPACPQMVYWALSPPPALEGLGVVPAGWALSGVWALGQYLISWQDRQAQGAARDQPICWGTLVRPFVHLTFWGGQGQRTS